MNILAFDTSLDKTYISLSGDFGIAEKIIESDEKNYHSAYLISGLKEITEKQGIELKDLDLVAVNRGPGSFTGIRVGMTAARTIAKELNLKAFGVNSLDILFETYQNLEPDVVLDARRNQFYIKQNGEITLVNYDEIGNFITKKTVICDASSFSRLRNPENPLIESDINVINFEEEKNNLSLSLLKLAKKELLADLDDKNPLNTALLTVSDEIFLKKYAWNVLKPLYIQAPPVFLKK